MILSVRRYLLFYLIICVFVASAATIVGNYILEEYDIRQQMDLQLAQTAFNMQAIVGDDLSKRDVKKIQRHLNDIPSQAHNFKNSYHSTSNVAHYLNQLHVQIWNDKGDLIIHTANAPLVPFTDIKQNGFFINTIQDTPWRIFSLYNDKAKITIEIAESIKMRGLLERKITFDNFYIMLLVLVGLAFAIWYIVGRGLRSLSNVAKAVANRAPTFLEPVEENEIPLEVKPLINELNKLFFRLQQAFNRNKRFAADAAHELRTPLAALKTQTQIALSTTNSDEKQEALETLLTGVNRAAHIVEQLLTLSRLGPEATLQNIEKVALSKLAAEMIAQVCHLALDKNIDIELISNNDDVIIEGNSTAISILMRNLIDNAIRYTPEKGVIKIYVEQVKKDRVSLKVVDNGPGIPPELRSRVFERFFRVVGTEQSGSGLGLAIVQQISGLHNASINLGAPATGTGLSVEVIFPVDFS